MATRRGAGGHETALEVAGAISGLRFAVEMRHQFLGITRDGHRLASMAAVMRCIYIALARARRCAVESCVIRLFCILAAYLDVFTNHYLQAKNQLPADVEGAAHQRLRALSLLVIKSKSI